MATLTIPTAKAFRPLLEPSRYKGLYGGRGSAKSHFFAESLLEHCTMRHTRAVCVREVQRSLEQSVKRLLEDKIESLGLQRQFLVMSNHIEAPYDGIIIFEGMQNHTADSIKSLEGYHLAWVEEAQSLSERSLTMLRPTIREPNSELWFSWNPRLPTDPVDQMLRGPHTPPDAIVRGVTYKDNPWFPDVLRIEMEWDKSRDPDKYAHVWLGDYERHSESRVFKNWTVDAFETPDDSIFYLGGDWGFSIDPTTLVRCFLKGRQLFIDREVYKIGCAIEHTPTLFDSLVCGCKPGFGCTHPHHAIARRWRIIADSARPETIAYLRTHGYPHIVAARKGQNSVKEGVIFLQSKDIVIHPRCTHTIDEFTMYSYKTDALTNQVTPILEDKKNHVIDAVRYALEDVRTPMIHSRVAVWG